MKSTGAGWRLGGGVSILPPARRCRCRPSAALFAAGAGGDPKGAVIFRCIIHNIKGASPFAIERMLILGRGSVCHPEYLTVIA